MNEALRRELIQVAAVAVAAIQDIDRRSNRPTSVQFVLEEIHTERLKQDNKWGADRTLETTLWMTILGEEFGEACKEVLER